MCSLERELSAIERQVYDLEKHYLEDTATMGNVVRGWDKYAPACVAWRRLSAQLSQPSQCLSCSQ